MSQAVPSYPPHPLLMKNFLNSATDKNLLSYGEIEGEKVLRENYSKHINEKYNLEETDAVKTVPQIFRKDKYIGGYNQLFKYVCKTYNLDEKIDRRLLRFMGDGAAYAYLSMEQAIKDSGLEKNDVSNVRSGLVVGSGGPSTSSMMNSFDIAREKSPKRVGPYMVPKCMSSTVSANLANSFKIKGLNFSITSACSTSAHCITVGSDAIRSGSQDIVFAGGGEEIHWSLSVLFDAMAALSSKYNENPQIASRPYDNDRDGFIISGGGGIIVLEELEHAKARGAKICLLYTSDAADE